MDFFRGMDVSMLRELEEHGAVYRLRGKEMDLFALLKECGASLIRLRLWLDPRSPEGVSYGGGGNDLETTLGLALRAKNAGLSVMPDFHYSDFWTDPSKQIKPKAWEGLTGTALAEAVYTYTRETLLRFRENGIVPPVIQIGNEITKGLLWPDGRVESTREMARLLAAGIRGAREVFAETKIVLHLDFGTDNALYRKWFSDILPYRLDFDVIGMSYYPFWNGSLEELLFNMNDMAARFGKEVLVAETAIGYTADALGCEGIVYNGELAELAGYPPTREGQEQFLRELYGTVRRVENGRGIGVIYWEPAWLPIPECAWASPEGCAYMSDTVKAGNSWANQALFDENGEANPALLHLEEY